MLSENRLFHYIGELTITDGNNLDVKLPKDDIVNWLFMGIEECRYGFIYKIISPQTAQYFIPFEVQMSFLMPEIMAELAMCGEKYEVYRGEKIIGNVKLLSIII